ncbi:hypothetical protein NUSPORA_00803 [Nucleospora cyclopteri]
MDFINKCSKEELFLIVGNEYKKIEKTKITVEKFHKLKIFIVDDAYLIYDEAAEYKYFCSCNGKLCWHILKVAQTDVFCDQNYN